MDYTLQNIYQRLRDFRVPAPVLDEIFKEKESQTILMDAWKSLEADGLSGDNIAQEIAGMIYKEIPELGDLIKDLK